ncbi:vWA domain-containing protein [Verrucomicrobium spinosum]|uniref:vWA domain-containing protein n=1 Tax=Verrucomicrobium spinosum TaxID=2736 RepID=UPI000174513F|nr:vWA domain-containing protein [Verrucomicrobium spinosum]
MKPASQTLVFSPSPLSVTVGVVFVLLIAGLAWMAWRRSGYRRVTGLLEGLRVLIAAAIAITLNQPEWRELFKPESKPTLVVLRDVSRSMETQDIINAASPSSEPLARKALATPLAEAATWASLTERMEVVLQDFSSAQQPPEEGTDLNGALNQVAEKHPRLQAVVLISDGDWNSGEAPAQAATRLRMRDVPVFAVPLGSESRLPDVDLASFEVPTFAIAGKPLRVPFTIESSLPRDEAAVVELRSSTGEVITKSVVIPAMSRLQDVMVWRPEKPGELKLTLAVPKTGGERFLNNNSIEAPLSIRKEQLHVLIIESFPRWEYRYLRNALERDPGVEVNCLLFHPALGKSGSGRGYLSAMPKADALAKYDVVFLGDVGIDKGQLTLEQCDALQKLVRDQAAGLVFMPGLNGYQSTLQNTTLADLLPVVWDTAQPRGWGTSSPGKFSLTESGTRSLLTKLEDTDEASARVWQNLPGFQWYAPAIRAKAGSEVLAMHGTETNRFGRIPLIVTKTHGAGKILFMGTDGAWRWRKGVEDKYHYRFWGQVVRWMAYQRNMSQGDKMRLFYSPDRPRAGAVLTLNANVTSQTGEPLRDGTVIAQITAPSGKTSSVRLVSAGEEAWGLFSGVTTPTEPGEHRVRLTSADVGAALDTLISVQGTPREKLGQPAKPDVLREIAQLTRGKLISSTDPAEVVAAVAAMPRPEEQERRVQIWAHPIWSLLLVTLMGVFWVGRKAAGAF